MINGIFARTPEHLLHEIVLYDDASIPEHIIEPHLKAYAEKDARWSKVKYFGTKERQGLIRAKVDSNCKTTLLIKLLDFCFP
jgi:hypothetical protein